MAIFRNAGYGRERCQKTHPAKAAKSMSPPAFSTEFCRISAAKPASTVAETRPTASAPPHFPSTRCLSPSLETASGLFPHTLRNFAANTTSIAVPRSEMITYTAPMTNGVQGFTSRRHWSRIAFSASARTTSSRLPRACPRRGHRRGGRVRAGWPVRGSRGRSRSAACCPRRGIGR